MYTTLRHIAVALGAALLIAIGVANPAAAFTSGCRAPVSHTWGIYASEGKVANAQATVQYCWGGLGKINASPTFNVNYSNTWLGSVGGYQWRDTGPYRMDAIPAGTVRSRVLAQGRSCPTKVVFCDNWKDFTLQIQVIGPSVVGGVGGIAWNTPWCTDVDCWAGFAGPSGWPYAPNA